MITRTLLAVSVVLTAAIDSLPATDEVLGGGRNLAATASPYVHENDMQNPFEDTLQCLKESLKEVCDQHSGHKVMLKIGGQYVDSNDNDYFNGVDDFLTHSLGHLMPHVPSVEMGHVAHILANQHHPSFSGEDLMILATDTEEYNPDIDTALLMSTNFDFITPFVVAWHGDEEPVLHKLASSNYICFRGGPDNKNHWCVGGKKALGEKEFCGCQALYGGCQPYPLAPAVTTAESVAPVDEEE